MIVFYLLLIIGLSCFNNLLWISIQPGQWLGDWQNVLREWDVNGKTVLYKMLGGCGTCTFHFLALTEFIMTIVVAHHLLSWQMWILSYFILVPITSIFSLLIFKALSK